jgi:hypothetical protein
MRGRELQMGLSRNRAPENNSCVLGTARSGAVRLVFPSRITRELSRSLVLGGVRQQRMMR